MDETMQHGSGPRSGALPRPTRLQPHHLIDVLVYVVVLNLAIEYLPAVISEGFTLSLLTAILLKLALEVVIVLKGRVVARFRVATDARGKLAAGLLLWLVAAGSKVAVLGLVNVVFGDAVSLGGFVSVTLLVITLLASRAAVRHLLTPDLDPAVITEGPTRPRRARARQARARR